MYQTQLISVAREIEGQEMPSLESLQKKYPLISASDISLLISMENEKRNPSKKINENPLSGQELEGDDQEKEK